MGANKHCQNDHKLLKLFKELKRNGFDVIRTKTGYKLVHITSNEWYSYHHCPTNKVILSRLKKWVNVISNIDITSY